MKKKLTLKGIAFCMVSVVGTLYSQHSTGLYIGNHNAPYAAFLNPSQTYSDKNRVYFNFWGANTGFTNNYLTYNAPFGIVKWANNDMPDQYKTWNGKLRFEQDWLKTDESAQNPRFYYLNEVLGPAVNFRISHRQGIGFGLRAVSGLSANGVTPELAKLIRYGMDSSSPAFSGANGVALGQSYSAKPFSINADRYQEWYFSYAAVTRDRGQNFWKWGGTGKILLGMGAAHAGATRMDYKFLNNRQVALSNTNATYFHTDDASATAALNHPLGLKFNEVQGGGAGFDLGFTYERRPDKNRKTVKYPWWDCMDEKRQDYNWRFGASVTDLGFIAYSGSRNLLNFTGTRNWNINTAVVDNYNHIQGLDGDRLNKVDTGFFTAMGSESGRGFATTTPAAFNAQLDVNLKNHFNVGVNLTQSLKGAYTSGIRKASYLSVVPRWEGEFAEVGVPVSLTQDYSKLNVGLYGRLGPVILGTDNLGGLAKLASNGNYQGANLYFALRFKLAACGWETRYNKRDTILKEYRDTVSKTDSVTFWKKDTVRIVKHDTIYKVKTLRDTIVKYKNTEITADQTRKDAELKKREADLKAKEDALKKRETDLKGRENSAMGLGSKCCDRVEELEREVKSEKEKNTRLGADLLTTRDELGRSKGRVTELEGERDAVRKERDGLKDENAGLKAEIEKLRGELAKARLSGNPCEKQTKSLDSLLAIEQGRRIQLQKDNDKLKTDIAAVKAENELNKKKVSELQAELAKVKADCASGKACCDKIPVLESQIAAEQAKSKKLQVQVDTLNRRMDILAARNKVLESQKKGVNCDSIAAVAAGFKKQLDELRKEYEFEFAKNKELEAKLKNCGNADELAKVKADLETQKTKNAELDAKVKALEKDKVNLTTQLDVAKDTIAALNLRLKNCKGSDCKTCEEERDEWKSKYEAQVNAYNAVMAEYQQCNKDLANLKAKVSSLENQLKTCQESNTGGGDNKFTDSLQKVIKTLKSTIAQLNAEVAARQKSLDELQDAYDTQTKENGTLKTQIAARQSEIEGLKAQVADLQDKLKKCQDGNTGGMLNPNPDSGR
ncbi:MAG: hypothetical protein JNL57_03015 [Bacteroidetes bacterium]|nr:hypothetical protein [Bacteroidota bacterium]